MYHISLLKLKKKYERVKKLCTQIFKNVLQFSYLKKLDYLFVT